MSNQFTFVPLIRTALADAAEAPAGTASRRAVKLDVEVRADGSPVGARTPLGTGILGAGDIVAVERAAIARVEPASGLRGFEPSYFPFIEFVDSDFPWRYSLDVGKSRVLPWLVLLALKGNEFEFVDQGAAPLPRINVLDAAASLPPISQSWAHAHSQVHRASTTTTLASVLSGDPGAQFSRLLCPRKLEAQTAYYLFLVPTFEAGRLAGLGRPAAASPWNQLSWAADAAGALELPVYHQSQFTTNALEDLEQLARRLRPFEIDASSEAGKIDQASARRPGYYADYELPGATFELQAALSKPGATVIPFETDPALSNRLERTLGEVIAGETISPGEDGKNAEDPLVAMPPYGWRFGPSKTLSRTRALGSGWCDRINLDLKFRHAAGLGAEVVRRNHDAFMKSCWSQYAEVVQANQKLGALGIAEQVVSSLASQRLSTLPAAALVVAAEPLYPYAFLTGETTLAMHFAEQGIPNGFASRSLRRVSAKRGARKVGLSMPAMTAPPGRGGEGTTERPRGVMKINLGGLKEFLPKMVLEGARSPEISIPVGKVNAKKVAEVILKLTLALPARKAGFVVKGLSEAESERITPVLRSPRVPVPLADELVKVSKGWLLNGSGALPENTVAVVEENRAFIEAFLAGANHEMNNELRWREFPTDMRGTILPRFWNRGRAPDDTTGDDIDPIDGWHKALGTNFPSHDADAGANLVLLIRGDVIRKLGDAVVVLHRADGTSWSATGGKNFEPAFSGRLGADIAYYGFDVGRAAVEAELSRHFFVIYEPVGKLRFGLDIATASVRRARAQNVTAPIPFPIGAMKRDRSQLMPVLQRSPAQLAPTVPATWDDLSWSHVKLTSGAYIDFDTSSVAATAGPDYWGTSKSSASLARSFWQRPIAVVIPAGRVL